MFSHLSVSHSVHRGACIVGGMHSRGHVWQGGMHGREVCAASGACMARGACVAGETATATDGTHPAGMHC